MSGPNADSMLDLWLYDEDESTDTCPECGADDGVALEAVRLPASIYECACGYRWRAQLDGSGAGRG